VFLDLQPSISGAGMPYRKSTLATVQVSAALNSLRFKQSGRY